MARKKKKDSYKKSIKILKQIQTLEGKKSSDKEIVKDLIKGTPKEELTDVINEAADENQDVEYALTPKALEMAERFSSAASDMAQSAANPQQDYIKSISKSVMKPNPTRGLAQKQTTQTDSTDADFTKISGNKITAVKSGDSYTDVLGKMYNLQRLDYARYLKSIRNEKKLNQQLQKIKEQRHQELMDVLKGTGKKGKKVTKKTTKAEPTQKPKETVTKEKPTTKEKPETTKTTKPTPKKTTPTKTAPSVAEKAGSTLTSTAAKVVVGGAGLTAMASAIGGAESGGNYDITFGDRVSKTGKITNSLGLKTPEEMYGKKLTEMTLREVKDFGEKRGQNGAAGKYQFMPSTLFGRKGAPGLVQQLGLPMDTKFTPDIQDKLYQLLHENDVTTLRKNGVPITPGYEYMAHYIGAGGATAVYKSISKGEDKTVAEVMKDNKFAIGNNAELNTIRAVEFESILENRLKKKGLSSPHAAGGGEKLYNSTQENKTLNTKPSNGNNNTVNLNNTKNIINGGTTYAVDEQKPADPQFLLQQYK